MPRTTLLLIAITCLFHVVSSEAGAAPANQEGAGPVVLTNNQLDSLTAGRTGDIRPLVESGIERPLVWGIGFTIAAIIKFKAHHGNPTFRWLNTPFGR